MNRIRSIAVSLTTCAWMGLIAGEVRPFATDEVLINPGMGFVHYQYSNRLWGYGTGMGMEPDDTLDSTIPGTSVVYFRVNWADVEPEEGVFRWDIFDSVAQNWIDNGRQIAIRIVCSDQKTNAVPDWVRAAGAKGAFYDFEKGYTQITGKFWEPIFDDPVFLEKLGRFIDAFAARYDGDPSVAFVDIGSFGMFGEGHTWYTTRLSEKETTRLAVLHMDLWRTKLPRTYLVISDDVGGAGNRAPDCPAMRYAREHGIGFRDDSIMCYKPERCSWIHSGWARLFAPKLPVVIETGHYLMLDSMGYWRKDRLVECVEAHQASYFTLHGFPPDFAQTHRDEIVAMNKRLGYRFELRHVAWPDSVRQDQPVTIVSEWVNVGVAPCHAGASLTWSLVNANGAVAWSCTDPMFNFMSLAPSLDGAEHPQKIESACRFGRVAPIPPANDAVLADLRKRGRMAGNFLSLLQPGVYTLCVSVGTPQGQPRIALPLANGCKRRYPVGSVTVLPASESVR